MNQKELNEILKQHVIWLQDNSKGQNADLRYANLRNADLRNANLRYADLRNADLRNADLRNANLRNADLRYADLNNADLRNADLRNADLSNANLRNANLDFSCFPLWCGSFAIKDDGTLTKQLLGHIARLNLINAPEDLQKWVDKIPKKYKNDICKRHAVKKV